MDNVQCIIRGATRDDYPVLTAVWERSVRATHDFLRETDLEDIKSAMPTRYLPGVDLFLIELPDGEVAGFIGISGDGIEMLFIDDSCQGRGYGSRLIDFALARGVMRVDVNEQNHRALRFYLSKGFRVVGRDDTDGDGRPYPILHLSRW